MRRRFMYFVNQSILDQQSQTVDVCHQARGRVTVYGLPARPTFAWWRHQMETFSALLAICAGNSPVTGEYPAQRPVTQSFDVFFDLRLNKRLSKQSGDLRARPIFEYHHLQHTLQYYGSKERLQTTQFSGHVVPSGAAAPLQCIEHYIDL